MSGEGLCLDEEMVTNCLALGLLLVWFWLQTQAGKASLTVTVWGPGLLGITETGGREGWEKVSKKLSQKQDQLPNFQGSV